MWFYSLYKINRAAGHLSVTTQSTGVLGTHGEFTSQLELLTHRSFGPTHLTRGESPTRSVGAV